MAKAQNYIGGGGTPHRKHKPRRGDTAHTFLMGETIGVGKKYTGGGHRTYFVDGGNNWGGDNAHY